MHLQHWHRRISGFFWSLSLAVVPLLAHAQTVAPAAGAETSKAPSAAVAPGKGGAGMGDASGMGQMHESMMKGMKDMQSMPMSGNTDRDFASMMRMHHQMAVDMAQAEMKNGKDAKMKGMAKKIIDDQTREIRELDDWLKQHKQ